MMDLMSRGFLLYAPVLRGFLEIYLRLMGKIRDGLYGSFRHLQS